MPIKSKKETATNTRHESDSFVSHDLENLSNKEILSLLLNHLREDHKLDATHINSMVEQKKELMIPVSVFNNKLSSLETIIKYLVENLGMKNNEIARILNRNIRTTWTTFKNANLKHSSKLIPSSDERYFIPVSGFRDRVFSNLETVVKYMKDNYGLSYHEIAQILKRDDSTIWTVYRRIQVKEARGK